MTVVFTENEVQTIRGAALLHRYEGYEMKRDSKWPPRCAQEFFDRADALDAIAKKLEDHRV